jgi:putative transposase
LLHHLVQLVCILLALLDDIRRFLLLCLRPPAALVAENLFLRKQLALYQERRIKPWRATNAARLTLVWLSRWFNWRQALAIVQPETFLRWHRQGFRLFWRWKSTLGRPPIPADLQALIRCMTRENPSWGEERLANELLLKLGLRVSPRTVRKYMPQRMNHGRGNRVTSQRWQTFMRTTAHPTAPWTLQQLREAVPADHRYRFIIHDRDSIFSQYLDQNLRNLGLRVLKTPPQCPQANALCEHLIGTLRRVCLEFVIPLTGNHLRCLLNAWVPHYNGGRPHMSLGPGIPAATCLTASATASPSTPAPDASTRGGLSSPRRLTS